MLVQSQTIDQYSNNRVDLVVARGRKIKCMYVFHSTQTKVLFQKSNRDTETKQTNHCKSCLKGFLITG